MRRSHLRLGVAAVTAALLAAAVLVTTGAPSASSYEGYLGLFSEVSPNPVTVENKALWTVEIYPDTEGEFTLPDVNVQMYIDQGTFDLKTMKSLGTECSKLSFSTEGGPTTVTTQPANAVRSIECELGDVADDVTINAVVDTKGLAAPTYIFGEVYAQSGDDESNSAYHYIDVVEATPNEASAFIPPGGSLSTLPKGKPTATDNTALTVKLPKKVAEGSFGSLGVGTAAAGTKLVTSPGASITISASDQSNDPFLCGDLLCQGKLLTVGDFEGYNDPKHPALVVISWYPGTASESSVLLIRKPDETEGTPIPKCIKVSGAYTNTPCVVKHKTKKGSATQDTIALLSGDPNFIRK
jgi:hypothetical protein